MLPSNWILHIYQVNVYLCKHWLLLYVILLKLYLRRWEHTTPLPTVQVLKKFVSRLIDCGIGFLWELSHQIVLAGYWENLVYYLHHPKDSVFRRWFQRRIEKRRNKYLWAGGIYDEHKKCNNMVGGHEHDKINGVEKCWCGKTNALSNRIAINHTVLLAGVAGCTYYLQYVYSPIKSETQQSNAKLVHHWMPKQRKQQQLPRQHKKDHLQWAETSVFDPHLPCHKSRLNSLYQ